MDDHEEQAYVMLDALRAARTTRLGKGAFRATKAK